MQSLLASVRRWLETSSLKQKVMAGLLIFALLMTGILLTLGGGAGVAADPFASTPLYYFSAFIKLIIVLLLIFGSAAVYRRWFQNGPASRMTRQMRLIETVRLSPRQALHLVSVGGQVLLIGATDQSINLISPANDCQVPEPEQEAPVLDFSALLQGMSGDRPGGGEKG